MKFSHPLMHNNFEKNDLSLASNFLKKNNILTQSKNVKLFEKKWSEWLGVKYSIFVNSGSSANFLSILAFSMLYKNKGEIIVPSLTWISDIVAVIKNGYKPIFVDINLSNLSMNTDQVISKINKNTRAVFITHAQGFNGLNQKLLNFLKKKKIKLIEDVCESHGAKYKGRKLGTFGEISNFSFYYAHHMSTIEGGMICTNNKKIYEICRILRSHGMAREMSDKKEEKRIIKKNKLLSPRFIFLYPGFNMRNNEISAVIGLNQLRRLNKNNTKRSKNLSFFLKNLNSDVYFTDFDLKGNSNYAFPLILKKKSFILRNRLEYLMKAKKIEFRRGNAGGGNQLRQPYIKNYLNKINLKKFRNVEHVHHFGYYIGNYPNLSKDKIIKICNILNSLQLK
jgi:CDP-6-deoxy-D-xylo-4-hexulose-3-dehydrase